MPELPDVEFIARMLRRRASGRQIGRVEILTPSTIRSPSAYAFRRLVRGRRIDRVRRRGKYLFIDLDRGLTVVVHLRMTGGFVLAAPGTPASPHARVVFSLGDEELRFTDQRRFGHMDLFSTARVPCLPGIRRLGIEPMGRGFTLARFRALLRGRRGALKALLLRQDLVVGIGNLYADEILFQARLRPARPVASLGQAEVGRLHRVIRRVLGRGIGVLIRDRGSIGDLLDARAPGGACPRCGRELAMARTAGRGTYYCRTCQR
jgi:formamidopyrimidine-DNA glycosylase